MPTNTPTIIDTHTTPPLLLGRGARARMRMRTFLMQELERQRYLGGVEARMLLGQAPLPLHVEHQVAAVDELDDEEEAAGRLEAAVQAHQERVVRRHLEHVLLRLHPVDVL